MKKKHLTLLILSFSTLLFSQADIQWGCFRMKALALMVAGSIYWEQRTATHSHQGQERRKAVDLQPEKTR
ncbi:MAG: hypothetical protein R2825_12885 [Saprospiraceae bacterium]